MQEYAPVLGWADAGYSAVVGGAVGALLMGHLRTEATPTEAPGTLTGAGGTHY